MKVLQFTHHTVILRNGDATLRCAKTEYIFITAMGEDGAFASLFCGMLEPNVYYAVMKVSPSYTSHRYTETRCGERGEG